MCIRYLPRSKSDYTIEVRRKHSFSCTDFVQTGMFSTSDVKRFSDVIELRKPESSACKASGSSDVTGSTLVIFFTWLGASQAAVDKYCALYLSRGFHVLLVTGKMWQFAWPHNSLRLAHELITVHLRELQEFPYLLAHGVSIGCFNYSSCVALATRFPQRYGDFLQRLKGVVLDSMTQGSLERMLDGVITGLGLSSVKKRVVSTLLKLYLYMTYVETAEYFEKAVKFFQESPAQVPRLVFASLDDPMSDPESLDKMLTRWRNSGTFVLIEKVWEHSSHCCHFKLHTEEYLQKMEEFLSVYEKFATSSSPRRNLTSKV